ncbi:macro domain-containing protein [Burkholderia cenocepacia]|uniref:Appr-1-p processing protein n=1 Tax=Burkholderia cenocepacia TaxID=95486 RepID=A0A3Q9FEB1_9BURK|nr:macro domain-containing protein [Burkholderia cenocepacia]AZQ55694.1 Appr-1-p processing protein [Burkholderia cenocepacia]
MKREYFHSKTEFPCGEGEVYTEFIDGVATRQISHPDGGVIYASSSVGDWNPEIGFLLFDGMKDELEIPQNSEIKREDFEHVWKAAIGNPPKGQSIVYEVGDAAVPRKNSTLIAHVVNNRGKWGRGFVVSLGKKYPVARDGYLELFRDEQHPPLGMVQFLSVDNEKRIFVANMVSQDGIRKSSRDVAQYVSYSDLKICLGKICEFALANRLSVQMPMIGAGLGGGDWEVISTEIDEVFSYYKQTCKIITLS